MQEQKKYSSVQKLVNLPKKRPLNRTEHLFITDSSNSPLVPENIKDKTGQLLESIQGELEVYEDFNYNFKFPQSKFPDVHPGQRNQINYEFKMQAVDQDTFKPKLTEKQIQQMRQKAEFQVQSGMRNVTIPYVWKVNDRLLRGRKTIVDIWENGLAWCYGSLSQALYVVKHDVPKQIKTLAHLPSQFFTLIFGRRSLTSIYEPNYHREVVKDFWSDIMNNQLKDLNDEIGHEFLEKIYLKYEPALYEQVIRQKGMSEYAYQQKIRERDEIITLYRGKENQIQDFKETLIKVQNKFQGNWVKIRRKILSKVTSQNSPNIEIQPENELKEDSEFLKNQQIKQQDKKILQKFHEQKYTLYQAHLKENLPKENISMKIIEALVSLITIVSFIDEKLRLKHQSLAEIKQKISSEIDKKYRIRSKNRQFKDKAVSQLYQPIQKQIEKQFYEVILAQEFKELFTVNYQQIYEKYIKLRNNFDKLVQQKKSTLKSLYVPERVFRTTYRLLPPYKQIESNGYYTLEKQRQMTIDTSSNFWKFKLYGMRLKSWTINCAIFLIGFAWVGPFGLRCLYGTEDFKYDEHCDYYHGNRYELKRPTVLGVFFKVLKGIKDSRDYFESLPDRGLFGKNISRYFNYFECYVFRLFLVGIVGVLILYPISIVLLSALCIVMVITAWIWVPLIMVVCYLFNILVFQFESSNRPSGILIRGVPLLSLAFKIFACVFMSIFAVLTCFIFVPIVSAFYTLYLAIQRGFRTFTDEIMLFLIKKLGRTPSKDTNIARKISGPGMSRGYYYSIAEQDVYILTQAALQKILANKFIDLTRNQIQSHTKKYFEIMKYVLKPFGHSYPSLPYGHDIVVGNKNALMENFNRSTSHYLARYPNNPYNVRFTQQQIDQYFENSVKIVKNFIQRENIGDWIFDQYSVLNEDYDELTRSLWLQIFRCGDAIFEPLEKIDSRFKLLDDTSSNTQIMRKNVNSVMKALQGEVKLSHSSADFNPAKNSLLEKDRQIQCIRTICNLHNENRATSIDINLYKPDCLLIPPRNLAELKAYDLYQKNQAYRNHSKVFQE